MAVSPCEGTAARATANFDNLARVYRLLEYLSFGPMLMRCRCEYLDRLAGCSHALILGDGDGRFASRLLGTAPELTADAVDASAAMLRLLSRRVAAGGAGQRIVIHQADVLERDALAFAFEGVKYDLVVSHFFLDCFNDREVDLIVQRIAVMVRPGAVWAVSEFEVPLSPAGSSAGRKVVSSFGAGLIRLLYAFFGVTTDLRVRKLPDYAARMRAYGFERVARRTRLGGLLVSELWTSGACGCGMVAVGSDETHS